MINSKHKFLALILTITMLCITGNIFAHAFISKRKAVWALTDPSSSALGGKVKTSHTGLMVIDFQNFCANKNGILGKTTTQWQYIAKHKIILNTKFAIAKARKAGIPIIYIKARLDPRIMPHWGVFKEIKKKINWNKLTKQQKDWNYQIVSGLRPRNSDYVVWKGNWTNGYRDTDLRTILRGLNIQRLVIVGVAEPACVYGTFLGTFDEGIEPIMLSDCLVPAGSDEAMENKVHSFSVNTFYPMMGARVITSKKLEFVK